MKAKRQTPSTPRQDASQDAVLNGVTLPDGTVVAWSAAFPR